MYQNLPNLVLGFHGCHKDVFVDVIQRGGALKASDNAYDWLGNGIYFWEQTYARAYEWAQRRNGKENAAVIGAVIQQIHDYLRQRGGRQYDSVRGIFTEGGPPYPRAAFQERPHIQLCICNPNCIKGYFSPLEPNDQFVIP